MSVLHVQKRDQGPASQLKKLRKEGFVPMALIDGKHQVVLVKAPMREARAAIAGAGGVGRLAIKVEGESKERNVIVKQVDQDVLRHELLTVTLAEVRMDDLIKADIEVVPVGVPQAVAEGHATLTQPTSHIKVRGKVSDLPEKIEVDVSGMETSHAITAHELALPAGIELQSSGDATIFSVQVIRAVSLEPEVPAEPGAEATEGATAEPGEES